MPYYLIQAAYTSEAWSTQVSNPQNVQDRIRPALEEFGGTWELGFYSFGEYDVVLIAQFPDNASAAAFSMAVSSGGAAKAFKTTPLMTIDEGMGAMRRAGGSNYRAPGR